VSLHLITRRDSRCHLLRLIYLPDDYPCRLRGWGGVFINRPGSGGVTSEGIWKPLPLEATASTRLQLRVRPEGGFYKRGCQVKTLPLILPGKEFSDIQPCWQRNTLFEGMVLFFTFVGGSRRHILFAFFQRLFLRLQAAGGNCQHGSI